MKKYLLNQLMLSSVLFSSSQHVFAENDCFVGCVPNPSSGSISCTFSCCDTGYQIESLSGFMKLSCHGSEIVSKCEVSAYGGVYC